MGGLRWGRGIFAAIAMVLGVATPGVPGSAQNMPDAQRQAAPLTAAPTSAPTSAPTPGPLRELTKADVDVWLDAFVPYALKTGDIGGGVITVVKDGQILTSRGFGYADVKARKPVNPDTTLFRPGSVSKLLTWTAVMQLVEAGKIDLDVDVNRYLDFRIPPAFNKPITMRHLLTHTAGFEETVKYLIVTDPDAKASLERGMKRWIPARIYAPGEVSAYSNYGAAMAGYIVERVSGERFEDYVEKHILNPLGMAHSTFEQTLPARLAPLMSKGYARASGDPEGFERLDLGPAGALTASGTDMGKFMIAHLDNGGKLLRPETARLMHRWEHVSINGLPAMGLGFYHEDRNGQAVIGHGGDTNWFHSDLHLYLDKGVGLFLSFNSPGKDKAVYTLRNELFDAFTHRYIAPADTQKPVDRNARSYGEAVVGNYIAARRSATNWVRMVSVFSNAKVTLNEDDTLSVSMLVDSAGNPKRWRSVGPWQWQEVGGDERLAATVENGKVVALAPDWLAPIIQLVPAPASLNAGWILPALFTALGVTLLTALSWPVTAFARWRYGYKPQYAATDLRLHRAGRIGAWLFVAVAAGWTTIVMLAFGDSANLDGRLDALTRVLQLLTLGGIVATAAVLASAWRSWRTRASGWAGWGTRLWTSLFAIACLFLCWFFISMKTLTFALNF